MNVLDGNADDTDDGNEDYDDIDWESEEDDEIKANLDTNITNTIESPNNNNKHKVNDDNPSSIHIIINKNDEKLKHTNKKTSLNRIKFNNDDYNIALERHQNDFIQLLNNMINVIYVCYTPKLIHMMLSIIPTELIEKKFMRFSNDYQYLIEISQWFSTSFKLLTNNSLTFEEGRDGNTNENDLINHVIKNKVGSNSQLSQLYLSLLIGLEYEVRYIRTIDPINSFLPQYHEDIYNQNLLSFYNSDKNKDNHHIKKKRKFIHCKDIDIFSWIEVKYNKTMNIINNKNFNNGSINNNITSIRTNKDYVNTSISSSNDNKIIDLTNNDDETIMTPNESINLSTWIPIYVMQKCIGEHQYIENIIRKNKELQYVIAIELISSEINNITGNSFNSPRTCSINNVSLNNHMIICNNVTSLYRMKYTYQTNKSKEIKEYIDIWLQSYLSSFNHTTKTRNQIYSKQTQIIDLTYESDNINNTNSNNKINNDNNSNDSSQMYDKQSINHISYTIPTKFIDFKDHPIYLLERHLKSNEVLNPVLSYSIGIFQNEKIYLQIHKEILKTKIQWYKIMKQIKIHELPIKIVNRNIKVNHNLDMNNNNNNIELKLYGSWQTENIFIPPVINNMIPVNSYGNIEIWDKNIKYCPEGTIYIDHINAIKVAKSLDIPYAPAFIGFERKGIINTPIIHGIVILKQYEDVILDACELVDSMKIESSITKYQQNIYDKWYKVIKSLLSRESLRIQYGH